MVQLPQIPPMSTRRRDFLKCAGVGLAATSGGLYRSLALAAQVNGGNPLAPRRSHYPARAKQLIIIYLTGGFSHVDTFDPKPKLKTDHGKTVPGRDLRESADRPYYVLGSPFSFSPRGKSGLMVSELFPKLGDLADDLCIFRTMHTDILEHFQST